MRLRPLFQQFDVVTRSKALSAWAAKVPRNACHGVVPPTQIFAGVDIRNCAIGGVTATATSTCRVRCDSSTKDSRRPRYMSAAAVRHRHRSRLAVPGRRAEPEMTAPARRQQTADGCRRSALNWSSPHEGPSSGRYRLGRISKACFIKNQRLTRVFAMQMHMQMPMQNR